MTNTITNLTPQEVIEEKQRLKEEGAIIVSSTSSSITYRFANRESQIAHEIVNDVCNPNGSMYPPGYNSYD